MSRRGSGWSGENDKDTLRLETTCQSGDCVSCLAVVPSGHGGGREFARAQQTGTEDAAGHGKDSCRPAKACGVLSRPCATTYAEGGRVHEVGGFLRDATRDD